MKKFEKLCCGRYNRREYKEKRLGCLEEQEPKEKMKERHRRDTARTCGRELGKEHL